MKLLFVEPLGFSGIFHHALTMSKELVRNGHDIEMVTSADNLELSADTNDIPIYQILGGMNKNRRTWQRGADYLLSWKIFFRQIRKTRPDIVHFHQFTSPYFDWLLFALLRIMNVKLVLSIHENQPRIKTLPQWITDACLWLLYRFPNRIIAHSEFAGIDLVKNFGISPMKIETIHLGNYFDYSNGNNSKDMESARNKLRLPLSGQLILFFGTIRDNKGLHVLIDALKCLEDQNCNCYLIIAGDMERKSTFEEYDLHIRKLDLHDKVIKRLGYVPVEELPYYFYSSNIVALPYLQIYQSAVVHLAYAFEKPVVASSVGGLKEVVIDGKTGYLVPPGDPKRLAEQLMMLMKNSDLAQDIGKQGRVYAEERFSWQKIIQQTLQVYKSVLN